jgi:DNA-binding transcriptional LysR family regulator
LACVLADNTAGEVRIGCTPLLAASFVSAVIDRLSRRSQRMVFHLVSGYVETLHRELSGRNVDLLIARKFGPIAEKQLGFDFLCHRPEVKLRRSQWRPFVPTESIILARLWSQIPPTRG